MDSAASVDGVDNPGGLTHPAHRRLDIAPAGADRSADVPPRIRPRGPRCPHSPPLGGGVSLCFSGTPSRLPFRAFSGLSSSHLRSGLQERRPRLLRHKRSPPPGIRKSGPTPAVAPDFRTAHCREAASPAAPGAVPRGGTHHLILAGRPSSGPSTLRAGRGANVERPCESAKRFGKESNGWPREEIVTLAREALRLGGSQARRDLVRTSLELNRLLGDNCRNGGSKQ